MNATDIQQLFERELADINVEVLTKQQDDHLHVLVAGQDALAPYLKGFTQQVVSAIADDGSPWETLTVWTRGRDAAKSTMATHVNFAEVGIEVVPPEPEPVETPTADEAEADSEPAELDLSQYCFTRNTMLLTHAIADPPAAVAEAVTAFHALEDSDKAKLLPALAPFLEAPQRFDIESYDAPLQEWFANTRALDDRQLKTFGIWISRYCRDPAAAMNALNSVLS
ncbi:MAG: hypothetical protein AAFY15_02160 [Cyanobacteria bacterium J06648_11]